MRSPSVSNALIGLRRLLGWAVALAAAQFVSLAFGQQARPAVSASKLSVHFIGRYTPGGHQVVQAGPRVIKILDLGDDMRRAVREYKHLYPNGVVVLRIYTPTRYSQKDSPEVCARRFWDEVLWPPISRLPESERRLIDYLEGPNEGDSTPTWESIDSVRWFARFWMALAPIMRRHGFRPCVGSIAVGNPGGTPDEIEAKIAAFAPALRQTWSLGGAWSYHAYSIRYTTDLAEESWYSLRYRRLHEVLKRRFPELARMPLILTEGGIDESGDPNRSGWQARNTAKKYQEWLKWFDSELRKDPYVIGVTLFQIGNPEGWKSFDLEPIAPWLAAHLRQSQPRGSAVR
ncbi:MAG: hypothetical protein ACUVTZ_02950 [Armatimonadota bacterium]